MGLAQLMVDIRVAAPGNFRVALQSRNERPVAHGPDADEVVRARGRGPLSVRKDPHLRKGERRVESEHRRKVRIATGGREWVP